MGKISFVLSFIVCFIFWGWFSINLKKSLKLCCLSIQLPYLWPFNHTYLDGGKYFTKSFPQNNFTAFRLMIEITLFLYFPFPLLLFIFLLKYMFCEAWWTKSQLPIGNSTLYMLHLVQIHMSYDMPTGKSSPWKSTQFQIRVGLHADKPTQIIRHVRSHGKPSSY